MADRRWSEDHAPSHEARPPGAAAAEVDPLGLSAAAQAQELMASDPARLAAEGVAGPGGPLPHGDVIQRAFGHHAIDGIRAHVGGPAAIAAQMLGAQAYATGHALAFGAPPDLHTAAHEAAHVVQQDAGGAGLAAKGGFGSPGDAHERHADAVADAVVEGRSAEGLLDAAPAGAPGVQLDADEGEAAEQGRAAAVDAAREAATADASAAVAAGLEAQEAGAVPVALGRTVLVESSTGELMATAPQRFGELADLVVGGRAAAAGGACAIRRGGRWEEADPDEDAARVVLPGERARFVDDAGAPLPLVGADLGPSPEGADAAQQALLFEAAAAPYTEAAAVWAEARARRQQQAEGHALGLSIAAADSEQPFAAYVMPVRLEGMASNRPLYVYDFLASAYDSVMTHGDLRGADPEALCVAVEDAACTGLLPAPSGTRVISFEAMPLAALSRWIGAVDAADRALVDERVGGRLAEGGVGGIAGLGDREIVRASAARKVEMIERIVAETPAGDGTGKDLMTRVLASMDGSAYGTVFASLVKRGTQNAFAEWVDGDASIMWLLGEGLARSGAINGFSRTVPDYDAKDGSLTSETCGVMLWVGDRSFWSGWKRSVTFAGQECTLQIGQRGGIGDLAMIGRGIHGDWRKATEGSRDYVVGAFMSGALDFAVDAGLGTLEMLDHPIETVNALYQMASDPGPALEAIGQALGEDWDALIEAAAEGNRTGDYTAYAELAGRWTAAITTAVTGATAAYKGLSKAATVVAQLRKLRPRHIAMFLRALLKKAGHLTRRSKVTKGIYAAARANPSLMRAVQADAGQLESLIASAKRARAAADEAGAAAKGGTKAAIEQAKSSAQIADDADAVLAVRRAQLADALAEQGVIGAQAMKADDLVQFARALADPTVTPQTLTKMRRMMINHGGGPTWETLAGPDPVDVQVSATRRTDAMKTLHGHVTKTADEPGWYLDHASETLLDKVMLDTRGGLRHQLRANAEDAAAIGGGKAAEAEVELMLQARYRVVSKHKVRPGQKDYDALYQKELDALMKDHVAPVQQSIDPAVAQRIDKLMPDDLAGACGWGQAAAAYRIHDLVPGAKIMLHNTADVFGGANKHAFLVVRMPQGKWYIVDPTFRQFFGEVGEAADVGRVFRSTPQGKMMADDLLKKGWVELNDETATLYGRAMTYDDVGQTQWTASQLQEKATHALHNTRSEIAEHMSVKVGEGVQKGEYASTIAEN